MDSMDRIRKVEITVEAVVTSDEVDPDELAMLEEVDSYGNRGVAPKTEDEINDFMYRNRKLIHAVLRPYRGLDDYDDLYQEAAIGFYKGIKTYDPKKGIKLTTYAFACARNQVKMYLRRATAKSRTGTVPGWMSGIRCSTGISTALIPWLNRWIWTKRSISTPCSR